MNITDPIKRDWVLRNTDVAEVWVFAKNEAPSGRSRHQVRDGPRTMSDPWTLRKKFSVVIRKRPARELAGTSCLDLDEPRPTQAGSVRCSRMFGKRLTELAPIKEAVATYMMRASEKLPGTELALQEVRAASAPACSIRDEAKYANGVVVDMPYPTRRCAITHQGGG